MNKASVTKPKRLVVVLKFLSFFWSVSPFLLQHVSRPDGFPSNPRLHKLLKDEIFPEKVTGMIRKIEGDKIGEQWEWCKLEVKMRAIERSTVVRYEQKIIENTLRTNLEKLIREECNAPGVFSEDIRKMKQKLEALDDERYRAGEPP